MALIHGIKCPVCNWIIAQVIALEKDKTKLEKVWRCMNCKTTWETTADIISNKPCGGPHNPLEGSFID